LPCTPVHNWVEKRGRHFADDGGVRNGGAEVAETKVKDLCAAGFEALVKRWNKCIYVDGGYVEKYIFSQVLISQVFTFYIHLYPIY
jgi:hypothetical protein